MPRRVLLTLRVLCGVLFIFADARVLGGDEKDYVARIIAGKHPDTVEDRRIVKHLDEGRGHQYKNKQLLKHIYPILTALLFAKLIVVPLILKMLVAGTSSAFVMSKIALVTSVLLTLSWLLGATKERAKLQIVQYPANTSKKVYGGWHVKPVPNHATPYSDWGYDTEESNDKSFFL